MAYTFRGGIHVPESKNTARKQIVRMPAPDKVAIPLSQHIGAHCVPCVKVGDEVKRAQTIGIVEKGLGCPVHSSVSGKVTAIEERINPMGVRVTHIVIENDHQNTLCDEVKAYDKPFGEVTIDDVIEKARLAGLAGMGGATFPTYAKIASAQGKVDKLIINCAECEPYITANHRLLLEYPSDVVGGVKILLKAFGLNNGIIAIEDNKRDAINIISSMVREIEVIDVKVLKTKYPQGDERQIIAALTGRQIPAGKLPADVGCVVFNAETCAALFRAFSTGMPLIERIVTVDGDCVKEPGSVITAIGTSYRDLIKFTGDLTKEPKTVINGGPMMGAAQWDLDAPVTKGTSAILVFSKDAVSEYEQPSACIRCGRCVAHCQMHLMPNYIAMFSRNAKYDLCEDYDVMSCVECGACSYVCPGQVPITALNRAAKAKINEKRRAEAALKKSEEAKK